jgi:hypothetical protein
MRRIIKLALLTGVAYGAKVVYDNWKADTGTRDGYDTPTGTDPDGKWSQPGYEDKSLGQAVNQDQALVDELVNETRGDLVEAEKRFRTESAGAPALARQDDDPKD